MICGYLTCQTKENTLCLHEHTHLMQSYCETKKNICVMVPLISTLPKVIYTKGRLHMMFPEENIICKNLFFVFVLKDIKDAQGEVKWLRIKSFIHALSEER